MKYTDRIHVALRVARPADKLETTAALSPSPGGPESAVFVRRHLPPTPLVRLQEIASLELTDDERNAFLTDYLGGLDEEELRTVVAVLSTLREGEDLSGVNADVWQKIRGVL